MRKGFFAEFCILFLFLLFFLTIHYVWHDPMTIDDIWVINLDKDAERWANIQIQAQRNNVHIRRWPATYGKTEQESDASRDGVDSIIMFKSSSIKPMKPDNNLGVVGCWLSHKRLLQHLSTIPVSSSYGHLILEDDVNLDGIQNWNNIAKEIPSDYDIVFLSMNRPICKEEMRISEHVYKATTTYKNEGNWGTQAYLVRHGSIHTILSKLRFMTHPIDVQYNFHFESLNAYIVHPNILELSSLSNLSSIGIQQ